MNQPAGKWGFAIRCSKKNKFVAISKNGYCEFDADDYEYIGKLLNEPNTLSSGVYSLPRDSNIEVTLVSEGFEKNENQAKNVLDYMKEEGMLRSS